MSELRARLDRFVEIYHADGALVSEQRDWSCSIVLTADDRDDRVGVRVERGRVVAVGAPDAQPDLIVTAPGEVLIDILALRRDPSEPYMFGELTVQGEERHFTRLDYVVTKLYPSP